MIRIPLCHLYVYKYLHRRPHPHLIIHTNTFTVSYVLLCIHPLVFYDYPFCKVQTSMVANPSACLFISCSSHGFVLIIFVVADKCVNAAVLGGIQDCDPCRWLCFLHDRTSILHLWVVYPLRFEPMTSKM